MINFEDDWDEEYYSDNYENLDYEALRLFLHEDLSEANPEDIEETFFQDFTDSVDPRDMEFAWGALLSAVPAVISGVSSLVKSFSKSKKKKSRSRRPHPTGGSNVANKAACLLQALLNPQTLNAVMSLIAKANGRQTVKTTDGEDIPVTEYINLLRIAAEDLQEALQAEGYFTEFLADEEVSLVSEERAYELMEKVVRDNETLAEAFVYEQELLAYEEWELLNHLLHDY